MLPIVIDANPSTRNPKWVSVMLSVPDPVPTPTLAPAVAGWMISPPVDDTLALNVRLSAVRVIAELDVSVVVTASVMLRSPESEVRLIGPVAVTPVGLTSPMVNALLSVYENVPTPLAASVFTSLSAWSSVTLPPNTAKLSATKYPLAPSVTFPVVWRVMVMVLVPVAVTVSLIVRFAAWMSMGPAMVVVPPMVMLPVLPDLPSVRLAREPLKVVPVVSRSLVKLAPTGSMMITPEPLNPLLPVVGASF